MSKHVPNTSLKESPKNFDKIFGLQTKFATEKFVKDLGKKYQKHIGDVIKSFQESSFPYPYSKIKGVVNTYRIRVGEYRIVYEVDKIENIIRILKIDKRSRVYDR